MTHKRYFQPRIVTWLTLAGISALLTQPSYAQPFPESSRQKAQEERKKGDEKANEEAYKAMMKRLPNSDKKVDPWGGVRAPSANPGK
jgi:hypothetical protein